MADAVHLDRAQLPAPRTRLIGREAERAAARSMLLDDAVPILTLIGTGGVGKTRLALQVGHEVATRFSDGVVWVDLTPLANSALVPHAIASALELALAPGSSTTERLARALRRRQTLLVLDNCEHVLIPTAELIAFLLARCPAVQVLATSRAPLNLRVEQTLLVPPLPLPADASSWDVLIENHAIQLFAERARAVRSSFALDQTNAPTVAALCRHLDGLPLAIELAAARSTILSPEALFAQMSDRLRLLRGGARDRPARHQTMRDTIAWSYALLSPREQRMYRRLAVFAGGFTLAAARAVATPDTVADTVFDDLQALVEQSLIQPLESAGEPRFAMLETIREYAQDVLAASVPDRDAYVAHAAYFLHLAEEADPLLATTGDPDWLDRLEMEHDNLLAALGWYADAGDVAGIARLAGALVWFWYYHGHFQEGRAWLDRALSMVATDTTETAPDSARANVLVGRGLLAHTLGEGDLAVTLLGEGASLRRSAGDDLGWAYAESLRGGALVSLGRYDEAEDLFKVLLPWWQARTGHVMVAHSLFHLGLVAYTRDDHERTRLLCQQAVDHFDAVHSWLDAIEPLHYLGLNACAAGHLRVAARHFAEALARLRSRRSRVDFAQGLADVATLAVARGNPVLAARLFGVADAIRREVDAPFPLPARIDYERAAETARARLGESGWSAAYAAGAKLSLASALDEAEAALTGNTNGLQAPVTAPAPSALEPPAEPATEETAYASLTRRERDVLALLCSRLTDPEIAERLYISPRTVNHHVANILGKLGAANRRDAIALAARYGLI